jgi:hypothetical protein
MGLFGGFARDYSQGEASAKSEIYRARRDTSSVTSMFPSIPHGHGLGGGGIAHGLEDIRRIHEIGRPVGLERVTRPEDIARLDEIRRAFGHMGHMGHLFGSHKKGGGGLGTGPSLQSGYGSFAIHATTAAKIDKAQSPPDPIWQPYKGLSKQPFGLG